MKQADPAATLIIAALEVGEGIECWETDDEAEGRDHRERP